MERKIWLGIIFMSLITVFAHAGEIKLTTYYPSPLGEYSRMVCKTLGVGDTNNDGTVNSSDAPDPATNTGDAWIAGHISVGPAYLAFPRSRFQFASGSMEIQNPNEYPWGLSIDIPCYLYYTGATANGWAREFKFTNNNGQLDAADPNKPLAGGAIQKDTMFAFGAYGGGQTLQYGYIGGNVVSETAYQSPWMTFMPSGNVGIGTTAPGYPLDINKTYNAAVGGYAAAINTYTSYNASGAGANMGIRVINDAGHSSGVMPNLGGISVLSRNLYGGTVNYLRGLTVRLDNTLGTGTVNEGIGVLVQNNIGAGAITNNYGIYQEGTTSKNYFGGKVGIGTTAPGSLLTVSGPSSQILVQAVSAGDDTAIFFDPKTTAGVIYDTAKIRADAATGLLTPSLNFEMIGIGGSGWDNVMILKPGGNIGIGTTGPVFPLHIHRPAGTPSYLHFTTGYTGSTATDGFTVGIEESLEHGRAFVYNRENAAISFGTNATVRMIIAGNGTITYPSDISLKKDIVTIPDALDRVCQLRGVNFRWKEKDNNRDFHMGVIGQEVEKVFPEAVLTDEGKKFVAYNELIGALVEAVKELNNKNAELEKRILLLEDGARNNK